MKLIIFKCGRIPSIFILSRLTTYSISDNLTRINEFKKKHSLQTYRLLTSLLMIFDCHLVSHNPCI